MSITKDEIIELIAAMSVKEIMELITKMEEKFGVSANAAIAVTNTADINDANISDNTEEKTEFDLVLKSVGTNKIAVIKAVRSVTGLGLKEAKDLVESAPITLKESISKNDAEVFKKSLEETGAKIEIK